MKSMKRISEHNSFLYACKILSNGLNFSKTYFSLKLNSSFINISNGKVLKLYNFFVF